MTNLFSKIKTSDTILKGGISNVHYVWRCEKGENTCEVCKALDGKEFDMDIYYNIMYIQDKKLNRDR